MSKLERRSWFSGQTETQAYYHPNRRTKFLHIIFPSLFGGDDDRGWRKVTNFIFGWGLSVPIFLISTAWERIFGPSKPDDGYKHR